MEEAQKSTDKGVIYKAKLLTVEELLKGNIEDNSKVRYIIPRYQRGYVWTEEDVQNLINDIKESIESNSKQYFLGGIVLSQETLETDEIDHSSEEDKSDVFEVIDGQQRLTTLTLVIAAAYKYYIKRKEYIINYSGPDQAELLDMKIDRQKYFIRNLILRDSQEELFNFEKRGAESFTVTRVDYLKNCYEQIIKSLIENGSENSDCLSNSLNNKYKGCKKLLNISKLICENILSMSVEEIRKFINYLLNNTKIVVTLTSDMETAYRVFETLNNRGKGLGPGDLLKNFLFYKVFSSKKMYDEIDKKWKEFDRKLEEGNVRNVIKTTTEFLKKYIRITGKEKEIKNNKKILKVFKSLIYDTGKGEQKQALQVMDDLVKVATIYNKIADKSNICSKVLKSLDFKLGFDIIAALIYKLGEDTYNNYEDEILSYITVLFLVFSVSNNTKRLSDIVVPHICENIYNSEEEKTIGILKGIIKEEISKLREEFKNKIATMVTHNKDKRKTIMLLQIANYFLEGNIVKDASLEHILPQKKSKRKRKCTDYRIDEKSKKDYIGNLTLIPKGHNSSANNRCFEDKIDVYKTSNVYITRSIYEDMPIDNTQRRKYKDIYHTNKNESKYFCFAEEDSEKKIKVWSEKSIDDRTKGLSELLTYVLIDEINNDNIDRKLYSLVI